MELSRRGIPQPALAALRSGNKVEAVRLVRLELGIPLKEALSVVDAHLSQSDDVRADYLKNRKKLYPYVTLAFVVGMLLIVAGLVGKLLTGAN